jgi:hypothetical protein
MIKLISLISEKNAGKQKVKELTGVVDVVSVTEQRDWSSQANKYYLSFHYSTEHHPDMIQLGSSWGVGFRYEIPDEPTYQSLKQYEGKVVEAKWSLTKVMTMDKLKTGSGHLVANFSVLRVLGDIQKPS